MRAKPDITIENRIRRLAAERLDRTAHFMTALNGAAVDVIESTQPARKHVARLSAMHCGATVISAKLLEALRC